MLKIENLGLTLQGDQGNVEVLHDINLTLDKKKIYVITGPNGGGKTSLAKTIMGIYQPTQGCILLDGTDITHMAIHERARMGVGYAFQQPARFKGVTVRDLLNIAAGPGREIPACDLLFDVGLCAQDYLDREVSTSFSGGELKRVEIATILARSLKVALFDEPEAGIDLWSFQKLTETFQIMNQKYDTTIVIISHQERILNLADEIILVADGRVSEITHKEKILAEIQQLDRAACDYCESCTVGGITSA
jgi:Fe-S cluster assembly ATP-binding protein